MITYTISIWNPATPTKGPEHSWRIRATMLEGELRVARLRFPGKRIGVLNDLSGLSLMIEPGRSVS